MPSKNSVTIELSNPNYVPVIKDSNTHYGGSQMWFPATPWTSTDYVLHNYGCGTIATADLFLYLALQNNELISPETEIALRSGNNHIRYENYDPYIRIINNQYTKTKRVIAVLGTKIASAINFYSNSYGFGYQASWKLSLTYYDMLDIIEEMLTEDIPVILSIGPNTPNLWGRKGVPFYEYQEINYRDVDTIPSEGESSSQGNESVEGKEPSEVKEPIELKEPSEIKEHSEFKESSEIKELINEPSEFKESSKVNDPSLVKKPYYYKLSKQDVNSHYVTVTGMIMDDVVGRIMLRISSWGKQYYINYEEYRDYVENYSGTFTSSIVQVKKMKF